MHRQSDSLLLEKLREGDQKAFDALFVKYYKLLVANAYFFLRDEQEAKDIVQEFLFELWDKKLYMRLEGDVKGYLYKSVQNRCLNFRRKQAFEHRKHALLMQEKPDQEEDVDGRENDLIRLQDALEGLPLQRKEALQRIYLEEKKYQQAADEMGISLNTLKTHLSIGLKNLRERLKKN